MICLHARFIEWKITGSNYFVLVLELQVLDGETEIMDAIARTRN
jgi:hypothetical protein